MVAEEVLNDQRMCNGNFTEMFRIKFQQLNEAQ